MSRPVRVYENLRSLSYAPFYLAGELGRFAARGVEVDVVLSPSPAETAAGLLAGRADVAWGGPMRVIAHHDRDPECPLVCFCNVVGPEPFTLLGREPNPGFRFRDLVGRRVAVVSEVPTPWLTLQEDLRRAGIDPATIDRAPSRTMAENVEALAGDAVDVIQVMEPHVDRALAGGAHVWHRGATRGDVGFSSFYTTRAFLGSRPDACAALAAALGDALGVARTGASAEIAARLAPYFPDLDRACVARCVERYRAAGIWPATTSLGPSAFVRLKGALLSGGFIRRDVPYARAVDDRFAAPVPCPAPGPPPSG